MALITAEEYLKQKITPKQVTPIAKPRGLISAEEYLQQKQQEVKPTIATPKQIPVAPQQPQQPQQTFQPVQMPRGSVASQQRAQTLANAPNALKPLITKVNQALDAAEQSKVGKFQTRAGEQAVATAAFAPDWVQTDTGSPTANTIADIVGSVLGIATPQGGGAAFNVAEQAAARGIAKAAPKVAQAMPKVAKVAESKIAQAGLSAGAGGAAYGATKGVVEGRDAKGIAKEALKEGALMVPFGAGAKVVEKGIGKAASKIAERKAAKTEKGRNILADVNEAYAQAKKVEVKPQPKPKVQQAEKVPVKPPEVIPEVKPRTQARKEVFDLFKGEIPMNEIRKLSEKQMADLLGKPMPPKASTLAESKIPNTKTFPVKEQPKIEANMGQLGQSAPIEPPKVAKPKPEVMRNAFRGQNGMVRIEFPDAYHADLFDYASKLKRSMKGNNPLKLEPGYAEHMRKYLAKNLNIPEDQVYKIANQYSDSVRSSIKGLEEGAYYRAADHTGKLKEVTIPIAPKEQPKATTELIKPNPMPVATSATSKSGTAQRGFVKTIINSEKAADDIKLNLMDNPRSNYKKITNKETVAKANTRIAEDIEKSNSFVMNARTFTAEHVATAHRLIDEFQKAGEYERAALVAARAAEKLTNAGQTAQAASMYNKLSPQGILIHAQNIVVKANEKLPVGSEPVVVTKQIAAELTDLATTVQKMNTAKESANNVLDILDKARAGAKLSEAETKAIKDFVQEAKRFVDKVKPIKVREPKPITDKRLRDNVVNFFDLQEQAARERIMKARGRISATPVDLYADYAIIGASKIAKGVVKFADWSEAMVKDFGEEIRPQLEKIYNLAVEKFDASKSIKPKQLDEVQKLTEKAIKSHKINEAEAEKLREIANEVAKLSGSGKMEASQNLQAILQELERPGILKKVSTFQTMMQLLNPKTIARNAIGNELFYRVEQINRLVAAPVDWATSKFRGSQREVAFLPAFKQGEYWNNWFKGWQAGMKGVNPEGLTTQYDLHGLTFQSKNNPLRYLEKVMGATLKSFDYATYRRAVNQSLYEMGSLDAARKGLSGKAKDDAIQKFMRNADENILSMADEYGRLVTFQDVNLLSTFAVKFKRLLNFNQDFGLGDMILKYPKTPANILMRSLEYSPAGFVRSAYEIAKPYLKKGPFDQRQFVLSLSRAITGSIGFTGLGAFLAANGVLTGQSDKDADIRELQLQSGQGQYQVNVDALRRFVMNSFDPSKAIPKQGDMLITYNWAQPIALSMALGVGYKLSEKEKSNIMGDVPTKSASIYKAVNGALETMVEQSFLQGIKQAIETSPGEGPMDKVFEFLGQMPASFIPTFLNQFRQLADNYKRSTYDPSAFVQALNKVQNRIPVVSQSLPIQYGSLGQPKEVYQNASNNLLNVFFNPAFVTKYDPSPEAKLVIDLINQTGEKQLAPRVPGKSIKIDGQRYQLTPAQWSELQRLTGEETAKHIARINPSFSNKKKVRIMGEILTESGVKARKIIKKDVLKGVQ